jgi:hypothetical protein
MKNKPDFFGILLIASMYCAGMYVLPLQLMRFDLSLIPGDLGDARLNKFSMTDSYSKIESQYRSKIVEYQVRSINPSAKAFAYMPKKSPEPPYVIHLDAMMAAQNLAIPTVNGYSGKFPRDYAESFYSHFDQCESYWAWMTSRAEETDSAYLYHLIKNVTIIGRKGCI